MGQLRDELWSLAQSLNLHVMGHYSSDADSVYCPDSNGKVQYYDVGGQG